MVNWKSRFEIIFSSLSNNFTIKMSRGFCRPLPVFGLAIKVLFVACLFIALLMVLLDLRAMSEISEVFSSLWFTMTNSLSVSGSVLLVWVVILRVTIAIYKIQEITVKLDSIMLLWFYYHVSTYSVFKKLIVYFHHYFLSFGLVIKNFFRVTFFVKYFA